MCVNSLFLVILDHFSKTKQKWVPLIWGASGSEWLALASSTVVVNVGSGACTRHLICEDIIFVWSSAYLEWCWQAGSHCRSTITVHYHKCSGSRLCSKVSLWPWRGAVFTFALVMSLVLSYSTWPPYIVMNAFLECAHCKFTWWVAYSFRIPSPYCGVFGD